MPPTLKAYVLRTNSTIWDIYVQTDTDEAWSIRALLGEELEHLPLCPVQLRACPVGQILWARGMRIDTWPMDEPGPMPGELVVALLALDPLPLFIKLMHIPIMGSKQPTKTSG